MVHKRQGYRFQEDWTQEHLDSIPRKIRAATTIPVNVKIEAEQHVLSTDNVKRILSTARTISLMDCNCRLTYGHCDGPVNVCLDLNEVAERNIANGTLSAREITFEEALDVLERTHEAGLVHMAYGHGELWQPGVVNSICSCCSCCCSVLSGVLRFGAFPYLLTRHATTVTDASACVACGKCVDRCQFGARKVSDGSLSFDPDLCFGCGLCVTTCPADAITLVETT